MLITGKEMTKSASEPESRAKLECLRAKKRVDEDLVRARNKKQLLAEAIQLDSDKVDQRNFENLLSGFAQTLKDAQDTEYKSAEVMRNHMQLKEDLKIARNMNPLNQDLLANDIDVQNDAAKYEQRVREKMSINNQATNKSGF